MLLEIARFLGFLNSIGVIGDNRPPSVECLSVEFRRELVGCGGSNFTGLEGLWAVSFPDNLRVRCASRIPRGRGFFSLDFLGVGGLFLVDSFEGLEATVVHVDVEASIMGTRGVRRVVSAEDALGIELRLPALGTVVSLSLICGICDAGGFIESRAEIRWTSIAESFASSVC